MKNIMGRISGIIRSADRKMKRGEIGVEAFKEVRRDLKLAQKIIFEEITTCDRCLSLVPMDELLQLGKITEKEAEAEKILGNIGMCVLERYVKYVRGCDYCSFGVKDDGEVEL